MLRQLLVICGPTATGKTELGYELAQKFNGEILSADSRQVYKEMDIGTGKGLNKDLKLKIKNLKEGVCYILGNTPLWGYDLVAPNKDFNVSQYFSIARKFIINIWNKGKLPIIVGGSGLYIKVLIDGLGTISIPPDDKLRRLLNTKNTGQLLHLLNVLDSIRANSMNESDRKNPRRLIRAIEIAYWNTKINPFGKLRPSAQRASTVSARSNSLRPEEVDTEQIRSIKNQNPKIKNRLKYDSLIMIGLTSSKLFINRRIEERVEERISDGFEEELLGFLKRGVDWKYQSMQSLGYRQYEKYFKGAISWGDFVHNWKVEEQKYAKRQFMWFKKDHRINWFEISQVNWEYKVEKFIRSWYHK